MTDHTKSGDIELRTRVLLSIQRALWGMIYSSIRGIAVGFDGIEKLTIIYYLDREPNDDDYENLSDVAGEVCSGVPFIGVEVKGSLAWPLGQDVFSRYSLQW